MKKQYMIPSVEVMVLSAELMDGGHAFGPASGPAQPGTGNGNLAPKHTKVF